MKITILGDVCPTVDTQERFQTADVQGLFGDLLPALQSSDLVVANLECALTDTPHPIDKAGPVLHAPVQCIKALRDAGVRVLSLANNHIRDCGTQGVLSTLQACHDADISTVGAGPSLADAQQPLVLEVAGQKVGIIAFAEHEFNFATRQRAGANWLDVYTDFDCEHCVRRLICSLSFIMEVSSIIPIPARFCNENAGKWPTAEPMWCCANTAIVWEPSSTTAATPSSMAKATPFSDTAKATTDGTPAWPSR